MFPLLLYLETQSYIQVVCLIALAVVRLQHNNKIFAKYFVSAHSSSKNVAKQEACITACHYMIENYMNEIEQIDDEEELWNNEPDTYQSEDEGLDDPSLVPTD